METRRASILGSNGFKKRRNRANSLRDSPDEDTKLRNRVKKGQDFRQRDLRHSKRRRRRADDDETSEESFNFNDDDEDEENTATTVSAGRMFPPLSGTVSDHHSQRHTNNHFSSSSSSSKIFPVWSSSVPRKARSAITKRSREWNSSSSNNITEQLFRQASISPTRQSGAVSTSAPMSPPSSSSNSLFIKKLRTNGNKTGPSLKPPKSTPSKQNSSNRVDLEIEIAEVLYGLMTQSHGPKKEGPKESSPISTSSPAQTVAPKRNRPGQVEESSGRGGRPGPNPDEVVEMHRAAKSVSPKRISGEIGFEVRDNLVNSPAEPATAEEITESRREKESCVVKKEDKSCNDSGSTATAFSSKSKVSEVDIHKFEIDLMALPPQEQSSPDSQKSILSTVDAESKPADKENLAAEESKSREESEETEAYNIDLQFDFGKAERNENKLQQHVQPESSSALPLPLFTKPRPKRCATHSYIARNIHFMQQLMKMNPFWQAPAGPASLFESKPIVMPTNPTGNVAGKGLHNDNNAPDKIHSVATNPNHVVNDKTTQNPSSSDSARRKHTVAPSNLLGPTFIFPYQQQPAVTTDTQYLAILQNNGYPFPVPPIRPPPSYRGPPAQAMPFFNGSFYPSQMIHPLQIQHHQKTPPTQPSHNNLSGRRPIAFSRSDLAGPPVFESSGRALNAVTRTPRPVMNNASGSMNISKVNHLSQGQLQHQLKQLQQMAVNWSKTQVTSKGPVFTEHLESNLPQNLDQSNISPSSRTPTSQAPSSLASSTALKNHNSRPATQTQNKISFGASPKPTTTNSQGRASMSPTNSSVSKGSSRTTSSNSTNAKTGQGPILQAQFGRSSSQGIMHAAQFGRPGGGTFLPVGFSYVHPVSAAVQVKPTEQKQPAGNDNLHAWQPDKK